MFPSSSQHHLMLRPWRWFLSMFYFICCCTSAETIYYQCMKITQCTRDHRGTFGSKTLRRCEKFVGKNYDASECGIDDQYTQFYFSEDVPHEIANWIFSNRHSIWHLVEDITFNDFDDLVAQINARGTEWDEEWEMVTKESDDEG